MPDAPYLIALEQCGLELQAPHLRTRTKRRIETSEVDVATLSNDSLRFTGWAPEVIEAAFPDLRPEAGYELEATYLCERGVRRVQAMTSRELELHPPIELAPATATVVRVPVPSAAYADGTLEVAVERIVGPDVVMSELRLYASEPARAAITVVGDSDGGLIGTLGAPDGSGHGEVEVRISGDAGAFTVTTDDAGLFRVPLGEGLPRGRHGMVTIATGRGPVATEITVDTRRLARGLREVPPSADRLDLNGEWGFAGGLFRGHDAATGRQPTRVPGHVIYDGLVPDDGVATFHRTFEVPESWNGRAVFLRCDGAYGRAEVHVNGSDAGAHGSGATSFDLELTPFLRPGVNELAITLTEYTPHAVLDDMSWYAHMSLLGIWRDVFLFSTPVLHLGQLHVEPDWDPSLASGSLNLAVDVINLDPDAQTFDLEVTVRGDADEVLHQSSRRGSIEGAGSARETFASGPLAVRPWTAEEPYLYDLEVVAAAGGAAQAYHRRIGFRRVETRDNQMLVNGAPIRIRGVNRHDSRILKGRALSAEDMRADVVNLRRANVNVIRTSHYPPSPHLLDICDEVGMFVFEQPPICFSGGFDDHHWTRTNEAAQLVPNLLEVTAETVARDQGHPSVIVWDLGNESRWGSGFDAQLALVRSMDPGRPTTFSFDLNELGEENVLVRKAEADRPEIRSYHYPGWDRTWQEDLAWLGSYDQPVVLDEYAPVFAPCLRGPGEGYGLAIDPGIRDYWGAGYQPFMAAALQDRGVIGGLIWGGFGEVFAIPLDLTVGEGPWAHLPASDYVRTRDHYPVEPGVFRRGDGDWGLFDAWNRPRPELWHVHEMYSPIGVSAADFAEAGHRLDVALVNRFSHRSFAGLEVSVTGGTLDGDPDGMSAGPGETARLTLRPAAGSETIRLEIRHPEGWLVAGWEWEWPGKTRPPRAVVLERAEDLRLDLSQPGLPIVSGDGRRWLRGWPELHLLDVDMPHVPVPCPRTDVGLATVVGTSEVRARLIGRDWEGSITARIEGRTVAFEYEATYTGSRSFHAKEVGLTIRPPRELTDLSWRRLGEWSLYPAHHVGRTSGRAAGAPGSNTTLHPAETWEQDATAAGSNDYRSAKRRILVAAATDGERSLTVVSDGTQHVRAELVDELPVLHVLDWYGGVRTLDGNHPIWSAYLGSGLPITSGTTLRGRVVLAAVDGS
ncbi:MAG TPA: glycoside hydrolase family 2 TIM barrel-domain containing protein [Candidatus Limnocylindrales bacterium]